MLFLLGEILMGQTENNDNKKKPKKMKPIPPSVKKKMLRKQRAAKGLCTECGKPLDREGKLCTACKDKVYENQKKRYEFYKSNGICPVCGVNDIFEHENICPECRAKRQTRSEENRERYRNYINALRAERVKNGLCAMCGKPSVNGKYRCPECEEKLRRYEKNRPKKYVKENWSSDRRCAICGGEPLVEGKRVCEKCYLRLLNSIEKREKAYASGEMERKQNQYWKKTNADLIIHARKRSRVPTKKDIK